MDSDREDQQGNDPETGDRVRNGEGEVPKVRRTGTGRLRRAWCISGSVMAMGLGAVGCGGEEETPDYVGSEEVCDGLFKGSLAKTIESVTGATSFAWTNPNRMDRVVDALKTGYESGHSWARGDTLCRLTPEGGGRTDRAGIAFYMHAPQDVGDLRLPVGGRLYTMGKQSEATPLSAALYFECVSPRFKGSKERPMRILGNFGRPKSRGQDVSNPREVNLTVVHAASLAVAKKLECENNGGLPDNPVLNPRP
ncbi:hypothetical protein [Streptomyces sp. NPDC057966]|uniref:hypothetical protein n=1 Tax=Streptomyces sp. NPDC057966 TaxID=3346292 RepID=UPI0036E6F935